VSPRRQARLRPLARADHVIDYTRSTTRAPATDTTGSSTSTRITHPLDLRRALKPGGVYDTLGGSGWRLIQALAVGPVASLASGRKMGLMLWWKPFHKPRRRDADRPDRRRRGEAGDRPDASR
jgi:hypothetical protein